jgi:hypothetical protein
LSADIQTNCIVASIDKETLGHGKIVGLESGFERSYGDKKTRSIQSSSNKNDSIG